MFERYYKKIRLIYSVAAKSQQDHRHKKHFLGHSVLRRAYACWRACNLHESGVFRFLITALLLLSRNFGTTEIIARLRGNSFFLLFCSVIVIGFPNLKCKIVISFFEQVPIFPWQHICFLSTEKTAFLTSVLFSPTLLFL